MALTSAQQMRAWRGPALFSYGFRPFFLCSALWAVLAMCLWIGMLAGVVELPTRFDPISWHAHEFMFGYLGAVLAGFLLTAVPNWTGRLPIVGWRLAGLFLLWALGRFSIGISGLLPLAVAPVVDLAFPFVLGAVILREIVAGKNWRNLVVLALLAAFGVANGLYHLEAARGDFAARGIGLRLGLATAVMMISVIGGRIIPSFTRNWFVRTGSVLRPVSPMQDFDKAVLLASLAGFLLWVVAPSSTAAGVALVGLGVLHLTRLVRWQGHRTGAEQLVLVLHLGYGFIPLGAFAMGIGILHGGGFAAAAMHLWMAGAIGAMTLAVMSRATLGHTGRDLHAGPAELVMFYALYFAVFARFGGVAVPWLLYLSGALWVLAFGTFVLVYGPMLLRPKPEG